MLQSLYSMKLSKNISLLKIKDYRLLQKFHFLNGYRVVRDRHSGIGGRPIDIASSAYVKEEDSVQ